MAKSLIVANWKMYVGSFNEAKKLFAATKKAAEKYPSSSVVVAPSALYLRELKAAYKGKRIALAAQYGYAEPAGAHTGEVSLAQLKDAGVAYALAGHSERRAAGESNDAVRAQVAEALSLKLTPILCVGERARTADGEHFNFVKEQLRVGIAGVPAEKLSKVIIAYEPVWAIGGETSMQPREMHEMSIFIRKTLVSIKGEAGRQAKILYGGSVNEESASEMLAEGDVDGLLVGHVSADPKRFTALLASL